MPLKIHLEQGQPREFAERVDGDVEPTISPTVRKDFFQDGYFADPGTSGSVTLELTTGPFRPNQATLRDLGFSPAFFNIYYPTFGGSYAGAGLAHVYRFAIGDVAAEFAITGPTSTAPAERHLLDLATYYRGTTPKPEYNAPGPLPSLVYAWRAETDEAFQFTETLEHYRARVTLTGPNGGVTYACPSAHSIGTALFSYATPGGCPTGGRGETTAASLHIAPKDHLPTARAILNGFFQNSHGMLTDQWLEFATLHRLEPFDATGPADGVQQEYFSQRPKAAQLFPNHPPGASYVGAPVFTADRTRNRVHQLDEEKLTAEIALYIVTGPTAPTGPIDLASGAAFVKPTGVQDGLLRVPLTGAPTADGLYRLRVDRFEMPYKLEPEGEDIPPNRPENLPAPLRLLRPWEMAYCIDSDPPAVSITHPPPVTASGVRELRGVISEEPFDRNRRQIYRLTRDGVALATGSLRPVTTTGPQSLAVDIGSHPTTGTYRLEPWPPNVTGILDLARNEQAGPWPTVTWTYAPADALPPHGVFEQYPKALPTAPGSIPLRFSEPVTGAAEATLTLRRNGASISNPYRITGAADRYRAVLEGATPTGGGYVLELSAAGIQTTDRPTGANLPVVGPIRTGWAIANQPPAIPPLERYPPARDPATETIPPSRQIGSLQWSATTTAPALPATGPLMLQLDLSRATGGNHPNAEIQVVDNPARGGPPVAVPTGCDEPLELLDVQANGREPLRYFCDAQKTVQFAERYPKTAVPPFATTATDFPPASAGRHDNWTETGRHISGLELKITAPHFRSDPDYIAGREYFGLAFTANNLVYIQDVWPLEAIAGTYQLGKTDFFGDPLAPGHYYFGGNSQAGPVFISGQPPTFPPADGNVTPLGEWSGPYAFQTRDNPDRPQYDGPLNPNDQGPITTTWGYALANGQTLSGSDFNAFFAGYLAVDFNVTALGVQAWAFVNRNYSTAAYPCNHGHAAKAGLRVDVLFRGTYRIEAIGQPWETQYQARITRTVNADWAEAETRPVAYRATGPAETQEQARARAYLAQLHIHPNDVAAFEAGQPLTRRVPLSAINRWDGIQPPRSEFAQTDRVFLPEPEDRPTGEASGVPSTSAYPVVHWAEIQIRAR